MNWFKFYGQEFLTDPKMMHLTAIEKALWVTMLCLASSGDGQIPYADSEKIMILTGIMPNDPAFTENYDFLLKFEKLGMITDDNEMITVVNFSKRQASNLTGYERVKKFREAHKSEAKNDNKMDVINDNAREDKIRIDKKRIEREEKYPLTYLTNIPDEDLTSFSGKYNATKMEVKKLGEKLKLWSETNRNFKKNNRTFLQGRLLEQFGYREASGVMNAQDYIAQKEAELEAEGNLSFKPDYKAIGRMS